MKSFLPPEPPRVKEDEVAVPLVEEIGWVRSDWRRGSFGRLQGRRGIRVMKLARKQKHSIVEYSTTRSSTALPARHNDKPSRP